MKEKNLSHIIIALILALLLAGCSGEDAEPTAEPEPTEVAVAAEPVEAPTEPAEAPTEAAEVPTEESATEPEEVPTVTEPTEPAAEPVAAPEANLTGGCVETYDESVDYFPDKTEVTHAEGFTVEYHNNYKVVTVLTPFAGAEQPAQYILLQCGAPAPEGMDDIPIVEVPVNTIVAMSTTYLPALEELGLLDTLVGVDTSLYTTNETVVGMVQNGVVAEIGNGAEVNVEIALDLDPDLIMTSATGTPEYDAHPVLQEAGLPVVINADYLDSSPLGRAEWVDFRPSLTSLPKPTTGSTSASSAPYRI
jgi:iron complex transport system substrate-binding protein